MCPISLTRLHADGDDYKMMNIQLIFRRLAEFFRRLSLPVLRKFQSLKHVK